MEIKEKLDVKGLLCPLPIVKISQRMEGMKSGEILEVNATDPAFPSDLKAFCKKKSHEIMNIEEKKEVIKAYVQK